MSESYRCLVVENTVLHYMLIPTQKNRLYAICTACCFMAFLCRNRMFRHNFDLSFHTLDIAKHRFELKSVQNSAFDNYSLSSILCWQDLNFRISDTAILYLLSFFAAFFCNITVKCFICRCVYFLNCTCKNYCNYFEKCRNHHTCEIFITVMIYIR